MTPAISFVSEVVPDKRLEKTLVYRYYPISSMKDEILQHVKEHLKCDLEDFIVDVNVEINLKMYNTKPVDKAHWYDDKIKPTNDTKNTGI